MLTLPDFAVSILKWWLYIQLVGATVFLSGIFFWFGMGVWFELWSRHKTWEQIRKALRFYLEHHEGGQP